MNKNKIKHARAIWIFKGKPAGREVGTAMCGSSSIATTDDKFVTCKKCLNLLEVA